MVQWKYLCVRDLVMDGSQFSLCRGPTTSGTTETVHWRGDGVRRGARTEAWLGRHTEEGDWQYSPEWWGTQGGGWGRSAGDTVFESQSTMGNGVISVTSHPASTPVCPLQQVSLCILIHMQYFSSLR